MVDEGKTLIRTILNRLQGLEQVKTDTALATPLKMERRNLSSYKERGSVPWERVVEYCRRKQVSLEWLVNGRGPTHSTDIVAESGAIYQVDTSQDIVYSIAADLYAALEGRKVEPDKLAHCIRLLHREAMEGGEPPSHGKITEMAKLL